MRQWQQTLIATVQAGNPVFAFSPVLERLMKFTVSFFRSTRFAGWLPGLLFLSVTASPTAQAEPNSQPPGHGNEMIIRADSRFPPVHDPRDPRHDPRYDTRRDDYRNEQWRQDYRDDRRRDDYRDDQQRNERRVSRRAWREGSWYNGRYEGRHGWWWVVGEKRFFFAEPFYPIPPYPYGADVERPVPPTPEPPPILTGKQEWYYCEASNQYYPYVSRCPGGWRTVPARPVDLRR